jgi:hypothetical protein
MKFVRLQETASVCELGFILLAALATPGFAAPKRGSDAGEMKAYLKTINDSPDELHGDITPSVLALSEMGLRAVPSLLDLMTHDDKTTRLHAQRALELIMEKRHGYMRGKALPEKAAELVREEWRANGNYDYSADAESRAASIDKWREWLAKTLAGQKKVPAGAR